MAFRQRARILSRLRGNRALRAAEPDLDPDMARGLAFAFLVKALARHAVTAWEGIATRGREETPHG